MPRAVLGRCTLQEFGEEDRQFELIIYKIWDCYSNFVDPISDPVGAMAADWEASIVGTPWKYVFRNRVECPGLEALRLGEDYLRGQFPDGEMSWIRNGPPK